MKTTEGTKGLKVAGYLRVSTDEQAREGLSLEVQEARIRGYCTARGWQLVRLERDEGKTGTNLNRPGMQRLLSNLDGVDVVCITKLDRLVRSVKDLSVLVDERFAGVALASLSESFDSSTASGRLSMNLFGSVGQWEAEVISERTTEALAHKRAKGEHCGRVPFGFAVGEDKKLHEVPEQMASIRAMKRMHGRGHSVREIATKHGVCKTTAHKLVTTDMRVIRSQGVK
jgi:site-specific DNA recombinase